LKNSFIQQGKLTISNDFVNIGEDGITEIPEKATDPGQKIFYPTDPSTPTFQKSPR